jgi:hypothetical protein
LRSVIPLRTGRRGARDTEQQSVEQVTNLHRDTLKRRYAHLIRKLSVRREGMLLGDALAIAAGEAVPSDT